jgi:hypothetical protein
MEGSMCRLSRRGAISLLLVCAVAGADGQEGSPRSNLTLIRGVLARSADSLAVALSEQPPGEVMVRVQPPEIAWLAEEQFTTRLREAGWDPVSTPDAEWSLQVVVDDIAVLYSNPREGGLFASGLLDRTVSARVRVRALRGSSLEPILDTGFIPTIQDTIASTDVEFVETSYLPFTQGRVPPSGFFSTVLEPVVILGTIAVAVLLLFTVRSS